MILFGIPDHKDATVAPRRGTTRRRCSRRCARSSASVPDLVVITDVCLCEYTEHGHCGVLRDGDVDNDATLELLAREAVSHARAGADIVAPSDMMDGRVRAIRAALDANGFQRHADPELRRQVRGAVLRSRFARRPSRRRSSATGAAIRWTPAIRDEALREVRLDIEEGADMVMVKPAGPFLDIIHRVKHETGYPLAAYQVSGEYAMIQAAARARLDRRGARDDGVAARHSARRRGRHHHVLRARSARSCCDAGALER